MREPHTETLYALPKVTQLVSREARIYPQESGSRALSFKHFLTGDLCMRTDNEKIGRYVGKCEGNRWREGERETKNLA